MFWKNMLRFFAATLAMVILFTGCNSTPLNPKSPVSIQIWHYYNGAQKIAFDNLVAEFNETVGAEQGIIVEAFTQGSVNELSDKVIESAEKKVGSDELPDIFAAYADTAYQVDKMDLVLSLDSYFSEKELEVYNADFIEEGRFDTNGELKIFPVAKSTEVMMLNKTDWDKFAAATGASADKLSTWEGLAQISKQYYEWTDSLTPEANDGKAFFGRDAMANYLIIGARQLGVELLGSEKGQASLNIDKEVLRRLWDNYYLPYISGYYTSIGRFRSDDAKTGDLICMVCSTSGAAYFPDKVTVSDTENYPIESQAFPPPIFEGGENYAVQQGAGFVVLKSNEARQYASQIFLKWFTSPERGAGFSLDSGYLPVAQSQLNADVIQDAIHQSGENISTGLEQALLTAADMTDSYTLYTYKAFEGGADARKVLETALEDKAKEDREKVVAQLQEGSLEEAIAPFASDEYFEQWYEKLKSNLEGIVNQ